MRNYYAVMRRYLSVFKNFWTTRHEHAAQDGPDMPPRWRRMVEQCLLQALNGVTATDYYALGLYSADMPWRKKRQYVGQFDLMRFYGPFNRMAYEVLATDKVIFHLMCDALDIRAVPVLALYDPVVFEAKWPVLRNREDLYRFLVTEQRDNLFFKIDKGSYGIGALSLGDRVGPESWLELPSGRTIGFDEVAEHIVEHSTLSDDARWIVQNRVSAHAALARVVEGVTPTLRVMTLNRGNGDVFVDGAVMRFGMGDAPVDNAMAGGVAFLVDTDSGTLGEGVYSERHRSVFVSAHPRTGVEVSGMVLPFWREAAGLCIESARKLPQFVYLGWDVIIAENGPQILEVNAHAGILSLQRLSRKGLLEGSLRPFLEPVSGITRSGITLRRQ